MSTSPDKSRVLYALRSQLTSEVEALLAVTSMARDEATHAESRPENKYDTRALEASYVAAGQGRRLAELQQLLGWYTQQQAGPPSARVALGSLLQVAAEDAAPRWLFVTPAGGATVTVDGVTVQAISPRASLGAALLGLELGEAVSLRGPRGAQELELLALR